MRKLTTLFVASMTILGTFIPLFAENSFVDLDKVQRDLLEVRAREDRLMPLTRGQFEQLNTQEGYDSLRIEYVKLCTHDITTIRQTIRALEEEIAELRVQVDAGPTKEEEETIGGLRGHIDRQRRLHELTGGRLGLPGVQRDQERISNLCGAIRLHFNMGGSGSGPISPRSRRSL